MKTVIVYRDGVERLRVPAEIRNEVLRSGKNILINSDLIPPGRKDEITGKIKSGKITKEIEAMGMRIGDNGNGLVVRWADDVRNEERSRAQAEYDALPLEVKDARAERNAIEELYRKSHKALHYDLDDNNVSRGYSLKAQADTRLKAWREKYPKMAMLEDAHTLEARASKEEELASGALVYDADGWISTEEQQRRHDEHKAKAAELVGKAKAIKEAANA